MVSVAVIGAGYWGKNLVRNFAAIGALAAVCESDAEAREAIAAAYPGTRVTAALDDILADTGIDAVAVATPAATHGDVVARCLAAGKHVFVEKPICLDLAEAEGLRDQAAAAGLTLMVGHLLLYHPAFIALRATVEEGRIGRLRYIYCNRASLGKIRKEENALWSFAPHDISMMLALTGQMPYRLVSSGGTYLHPNIADTSLTHMSFDEGLQGHVFVSWLHPFKEQRTIVVGTEGMAVFDDLAQGDAKLQIYRHRIGWDGDRATISKADGEAIPYGSDEPLRMECEHFLHAVANGSRPRSDAQEAINVLRVLDACQTSLNSGDPVKFGDEK